MAYITKPGKHGTLYLYRIVYRNDGPDDLQRFTWRTYAYDAEHALNKFLMTVGKRSQSRERSSTI